MERTFANRVLMVRPASFGANAETAASNVFQSTDASPDALFAARGESVELERGLRDAGVDVLVFDEERDAREGAVSPDACFPNNWFTTHASGRLVLYPMESPSRRREIRSELVDLVMDAVDVREVLDLRHWAERGRFLEGTGSLVLDREAKVAFAALSSRTCEGPLAEWCDAMGTER
ncbi:MAG: arginine deiminase-related protein [Planctomycetota bacterium]